MQALDRTVNTQYSVRSLGDLIHFVHTASFKFFWKIKTTVSTAFLYYILNTILLLHVSK